MVVNNRLEQGLRGALESVTRAHLQADQLVAAGRMLDALDLLCAANTCYQDTELEQRILELRRDAYNELASRIDGVSVSPIVAAAAPAADGIPEIAAVDLNAGLVRGAIESYGCLLVRGLAPRQQIAALPGNIDQVLDIASGVRHLVPSEDTRRWYSPLSVAAGGPPAGNQTRRAEKIKKGAFWTADSPRLFAELCDLIGTTGVGHMVREYFGERPAISYQKCNLRRMRGKEYWSWHQDGAFLGTEVRSLNMWMALSDCGIDAPSLDVVPRRVDYIVDTGTEGAEFSWSIAPDKVIEAALGTPVERPVFAPGDTLFFDHFLLHRAGGHARMPNARYAIECWFFAPSAYPRKNQLPLVF